MSLTIFRPDSNLTSFLPLRLQIDDSFALNKFFGFELCQPDSLSDFVHLFILYSNFIYFCFSSRQFTCKICSASFNTYKVLKRHSDGHETVLKYPCDLCSRRFRHKYYLDTHRTTHTQIRKHSCQYCDQSFNTPGGLRNHIGLHSGIRSYKCGICSLTFLTSSAATIHRRQHRVGNAFKCERCSVEIKHFTFFKMHVSTCCPDKISPQTDA